MKRPTICPPKPEQLTPHTTQPIMYLDKDIIKKNTHAIQIHPQLGHVHDHNGVQAR